MKNSLRPILIELLYLTSAFILTILIYRVVLVPFISAWDEQRQDTYIVFSAVTIIVPIFLLVAFVFYFIKEILNKFSRTLPNIILLITGILFIMGLVSVNKEIIKLGVNCGWTAYPPLPMLPEAGPQGPLLNPFTAVVTNVLTGLQITVTLALLYTSFQWGRGTKQST